MPPRLVALAAALLGPASVAAVLRPRRVVVAGDSMAPALLPGDRLVVLRLPPRPGDVAAFVHPRRRGIVAVKRTAAVPGGTVRVSHGAVLEAGEGYVFLGDNLAVSTDSRHFGAVARRAVLGRAVYRYAPEVRRGPVPPLDGRDVTVPPAGVANRMAGLSAPPSR